MRGISKLITTLLLMLLMACSTVDDAIDKVEDIVPGDLKGKDKTIFGSKDYADAIVSRVVPKWFKVDSRFALTLNTGEIPPHLFYDVKPDLIPESYKVNFVISTPQGSDKIYGIDISSGQQYVDKVSCEQKDITGKYSGTIYEAPFNMGVIPRMLDQLGQPQKIIVFGDEAYYSKNFKGRFFDARIIGGYIEKVCPFGACAKLDDLISRLVVVGVQGGSKDFKDVRSIEALRLKVNWPEVQAFVENGFGKNGVAGAFYPAFRMGPELTALQTVTSLKTNSMVLSNRKLNQMRGSCYKLYDYIWGKVAADSKVETKLKRAKSLKQRKEILRSTRQVRDRFFHERFVRAYRRYSDEFNTCAKFIYPSNVHENIERHWFFAYYSAVHLLKDLRYAFDCSRTLWVRNPVSAKGVRRFNSRNEFQGCNPRQIDLAFEYAISFLENLRFKNYSSYRYIDYDRHSFGTHNKIYGWVYQENRAFQCFGKQKDLVREVKGFPEDIRWRRRAPILRTSRVVK